MRINEISVDGLFGIFDHTIPMNVEDRVTVIFGPNGFGKTYTLRLVDALMNGRIESFSDIPFQNISVTFDNKTVLKAYRSENDEFFFSISGEKTPMENISQDQLRHIVSSLVPVRMINTQRLLQLSDVVEDRKTINDYSEELKNRLSEQGSGKKIDILISVVNSRFAHKKLGITAEKGFFVETASGAILRPDQLSSGEQHMIVLLYDLLFTVKPDSFIMIDEPELSLHIFWQQQFIADILNIIRLVGFDVLIATHSPQIIHDRWDLTVELKGPGE